MRKRGDDGKFLKQEVKDVEIEDDNVFYPRTPTHWVIKLLFAIMSLPFVIVFVVPLFGKYSSFFQRSTARLLINFPADCQDVCEPCNLNECWGKCECHNCITCLYYTHGYNAWQ